MNRLAASAENLGIRHHRALLEGPPTPRRGAGSTAKSGHQQQQLLKGEYAVDDMLHPLHGRAKTGRLRAAADRPSRLALRNPSAAGGIIKDRISVASSAVLLPESL